MALTKNDIVEKLSGELGLPEHRIVDILKALIELMKSTLGSGEDVLVSGFGKFRVQDKNKRRGRNPSTGEDLMLKSRKIVTFKCSGKLRERLNGN